MGNIPEKQLSVVVPFYNEEGNLAALYQRLTDACSLNAIRDYELVFVNDGSTDRGWSMLEDIARTDKHVVGFSLSRNYGHQIALTAGLNMCRGNRILIIDADLQDPPELLGEMMRMMDDGADIVYGKRTERKGESWFKKMSAHYFYRLFNALVDIDIPPDAGDFRLMKRRVLDVLKRMPEQHRFIRGMVCWIGFNQVPIAYERQERFAGRTKYPVRKMARFAADAITAFSIKPLKIASIMGIGFGVLGVLGIVYALASWLFYSTITGWTSVIIAVFLLSSVQLITLGILGEYIGRLYLESKQRPLFIIDESLNYYEPTDSSS